MFQEDWNGNMQPGSTKVGRTGAEAYSAFLQLFSMNPKTVARATTQSFVFPSQSKFMRRLLVNQIDTRMYGAPLF